jgi:hypothetical protein
VTLIGASIIGVVPRHRDGLNNSSRELRSLNNFSEKVQDTQRTVHLGQRVGLSLNNFGERSNIEIVNSSGSGLGKSEQFR